ncbi:MAG: hypothetical protein M1834_002069 [Cirrosporium novae-zelandiae]|nr:MAG: hypothetical protein M1834_002069 [Cirrosporium novae-zelandiae]
MSSNHTSLDAAANERKARLAKLRSLKRKQSEVAEDAREGSNDLLEDEPLDDAISKHLTGRNYDFETRGPKLGFENTPIDGQITLEDQAKEISEAVAEEAMREEAEDKPIDLFKLQPKKPTADLKRRLDEKMTILRPRTQNAIARLVRERIEGTQKAQEGRNESTKEGEDVTMEGVSLVEGIHLREQEEIRDHDMI